MSILVKPFTFSAGATIIASEHNSCFDVLYSDYNGNIQNTNIAANAAIVDTKLATISTSQKVNTSALVTTSQVVGDILYADTTTTYARKGIGGPTHFLVGGTTPSYRQINLATADVAGILPGGNTSSRINIYTSSDTFTAPASVTKVYLSMCGGGGGGGGSGDDASEAGGGGGSGGSLINYPFTVTPGNSYTVTIGTGGTAGVGGTNGTNGGAGVATVFDSVSATGGNFGSGGTGGSPGSGGTAGGTYNSSGQTAGSFMTGGIGAAGVSNVGGGGGGTPFGGGGGGGSANTAGTAGAANTGGGGGGAGSVTGRDGGAGGSGICIVMY